MTMAKMTNLALLDAFRREVCVKFESDETGAFEDIDWFALSIGFFLAKGATRFEFRADGMLMEHISCETCDDLSNTMKVRVSKNKQARS